jgi:(2Fe-2S) ferredoxin
MSEPDKDLEAAAQKIGIGAAKRHVFLCTGPSCCTPEVGMAAWEALKKEIKDKGLTAGPHACQRTKVGCLRICCHGPTLVVYPEGTWYCGLTAERLPRFVQEHLVEGRPVREWVFAENPLGEDSPQSTQRAQS